MSNSFISSNFLRSNDLGLFFVRLSVGGLMLFHGVSKMVYGVDWISGMLANMGLPGFLAYGAILGELVASIMILLGVWTRCAAVVMAGTMVVAILMVHSGEIFSINATTGGWAIELPMLYLLGSVALAFTGGGRFALTKGGFLS